MSIQSNQPLATAAAQKYHAMFDIPSLSSQQLINDTFTDNRIDDTTSAPQWKIDGRNALLVDVRSEPERKVSIISGAISLHDLNMNVIPKLIETDRPSDDMPSSIIMYCTIGYRSGMEGQKLMKKYPALFRECEQSERNNLNESKLQIRNMDGIVNFANVLESSPVEQSMMKMNNLLIDPKTMRPTNKVHVYGSSWKQFLDERYEPVIFSKVEFSWRGLGILCQSIMQCTDCISINCCR